ncbi:MAG TPA: hypothetical protein VI383_10855 [Gemmatimonadales bacterium]|nr:hypothetical protein [Gemmatimonadales bacterium]
MSRLTLIPLAALTISLGACSDLSGPSPGPGQGRVNLSFGTTQNGSSSGPALAEEPMALGGTVLVFQQVEIVLREIELKRLEGTFSCDNRTSGSDDDCEELELGPLLVDLSLDGRTEQVLSVPVDTGTYRRLEFEIHKPDDDTRADSAFLSQHPDLKRVSIRARGTWNGSPFVFTTDLNVEQRFELMPPIVVREGQTSELTLRVDLRDWFLNFAGTAFINPQTANHGGQNENLVRDNIRLSIEALASL